jgi:hypothetical protein
MGQISEFCRVAMHRVLRGMRRRAHLHLETVRRARALLWHRLYHVRYRSIMLISRHRAIAAVVTLLALVGISALWIPVLQGFLERLFVEEQQLQGVRSLFQTLGGALLGATAIVSSLVLFSMQVNVERMPHGLFRRLSADLRLLGAFAAAFCSQ